MTPRSRDHVVGILFLEDIKKVAAAWRRAAGLENAAHFNVVDFFHNCLKERLPKRPVILKLTDGNVAPNWGSVSYNPTTLSMDRGVWLDGRLNEPSARYIVSHEFGHLILHDNAAKPFSPVSSDPLLKNVMKEEMAEWQAHSFAEHFLVPDAIVRSFGCTNEIVNRCGVERWLAEKRVLAFGRENKWGREGESCQECGNFTMVRNGTCLKCDTCGSTSGCS